ncbi:ABC transporter family substrate-binding protein [Allokutzneria sp. A3M-2-11 16]|uniref:ABC transporter family substrate-binding protein n=1 Tax=Allokutzneria sp. A3M-2-11 16 TaxID=2962043 RepID=UPI0020B7324D|nr:ABC transporter family substrate-binding protein [Allokutzneria sp. A3M-2-11 16]MCP3798508.1 ABC transporter family substrate-binding protein [Allokutzneria sp. A3M-2-11 16]
MLGRRQPALLFAALTAGALVLSACGGGGSNPANNLQGKVNANDINVKPASELKDGGEFRWPVSELSTQFNRNHLNGTLADNARIVNALMPTMFNADSQGQFSENKNYVESGKLVSTEPQVVEYKLNPKAVWSDGTPLSWKDFEAQFKAMNGTNPAFVGATTTGYEDIEKVERGANDQEVKVTFKKKFGDWRTLFTLLYPASTNSDPKVFNDGWKDKPQVTAGPFKFDSIDRGAKIITLVPNDKWWGEKPKLSKIIFRQINIDSQAQSFAAGDIDYIDIGPSVSTFQQVQPVQGAAIRKALAPDFRHITFNGAKGSILEDPKLRLAIQKAVDRTTIAKSQVGAIIPDAKPLNNHIFVEGLKDYKDQAQLVAYNKDQAAKELDELGWKLEGATRKKDGKELAIRNVIPTAVEVSANEAKQVQQMLAAVGVKVDIQTVPSELFFKEYVNKSNFDITHFSWLGTPAPTSSKNSIYGYDANAVKQNYGRIGNETTNKLLADARAELDDAKRAELANKADEEIWKSGHSLLLYQRPNAVGVKANLANYGAFGFATIEYEKIGYLK